jgi:hypothetical protein
VYSPKKSKKKYSDTGSRTRVCPVKADRDSRYTISELYESKNAGTYSKAKSSFWDFLVRGYLWG